jgi:uncharacterized protein YbjT (DUF2867 family)
VPQAGRAPLEVTDTTSQRVSAAASVRPYGVPSAELPPPRPLETLAHAVAYLSYGPSRRGEVEAQRAEEALQATGADWTIVRCSWFAQNFSEGYLLEPVLAGEVGLPVGDVPEPFVDVADVADVAAAALTEDGHAGQVYELTGPRSLTFAEAVEEIGRPTGRELRFIPVAIGDYEAALAAHGVPADVAGLIGYLFTEVLDGRNAMLADGVQRALGREPRDFAAYARDAAAAGAWDG